MKALASSRFDYRLLVQVGAMEAEGDMAIAQDMADAEVCMPFLRHTATYALNGVMTIEYELAPRYRTKARLAELADLIVTINGEF